MPDPKTPPGNDSRDTKILVVSTLYPSPRYPGLGLFARARLQHLGELADLRVIVPVPMFDYRRRLRPAPDAPAPEMDGGIRVRYLRWLYPPGLGALHPFWLFCALYREARRLRWQFPFQLVDAQFGYPDGVAAALLSSVMRVPCAITLRGSEPVHARNSMKRCLLGWALRRAARVIAVSRPLQEFAGSLGCRPERVRTIPNGVDAALFRPRDRRACRLRCSLPVEGRIILSVGNLIELKGHHRVVAALGQLRRQGMAALLLIAGDAGREASAESLIRAEIARWNLEDSVRFTGLLPAEKLADYMSAADLLCLASSREGSPNVIREALSCGTPVVATDVGGIPDLIPSEQYGLLVPARDTGALANALARALGAQWDREQIAAWGGQRSWEMAAREVFQELRAALAPPV